MTKVLIVATSHKTHGGITAVINAHKRGAQWQKYHCRWIETHRDGGTFCKLAYLLRGFTEYVFLLPWYDIVHIHVGAPPSAIRKTVFLGLAKLCRKKTIVHLHAFSPESSIRSNRRGVYKYLFEYADRVIVLSKYWQREVRETFPDLSPEKVRILLNPCVAEVRTEKYETKKQLLFAAVLNGRKGYADLIRAFAKIAPKHEDWKIVFAGSGEIEQAKELAKRLRIENQTEFLGWVNGEKKDRVFKESAAVCLPSYAEGFPMTVLDAWAYGKPVIATPVGGLPDMATDGKNVLMFEPGDINALADKMEVIITDESLRKRLSDEALKLAQTTFNPENINRQLGEIYKEVAGK